MNELYSAAELHTLTGYARSGQQAAWLADNGIPHKVDDKRVIVSRVHVQEWRDMRKRASDLADDMESASKLLQHSSTKLTANHYRTKPTKLKAVR